jgi:iron complex transport system permease protein
MQKLKVMRNNRDKKTGTVFFAVLAVLMFLLAFFLSVSAGSVGISFSDIMKAATGRYLGIGSPGNVTQSVITIFFDIRMPRVVLAALVGASLSIAGAAMQGLLKNPLADGSTLGITSGGALGAVLSIVLGMSMPFFNRAGLVFMSIAFSFISLILILALTYKIDYSLSTNTIILTGVIFSMLAGSVTSLLVTISGNNLKQVVFWSMGSFSGRGWSHVMLMLPFFVIGTTSLLALSRELNAFSLGEEQARYIGVNTKKVKLFILVIVSVLVGVSVAVSGTIGFVGLVIPHITRLLTGPDHKKLLPMSIAFGAIFLMLTDLLARTVLNPSELPIGVVTSFIGALLFIYIFYTQTRKKA